MGCGSLTVWGVGVGRYGVGESDGMGWGSDGMGWGRLTVWGGGV